MASSKAGITSKISKCINRGGNWHDELNLCVKPGKSIDMEVSEINCECDKTAQDEDCTCELIIDEGHAINVGEIRTDELNIDRLPNVELDIESI